MRIPVSFVSCVCLIRGKQLRTTIRKAEDKYRIGKIIYNGYV